MHAASLAQTSGEIFLWYHTRGSPFAITKSCDAFTAYGVPSQFTVGLSMHQACNCSTMHVFTHNANHIYLTLQSQPTHWPNTIT